MKRLCGMAVVLALLLTGCTSSVLTGDRCGGGRLKVLSAPELRPVRDTTANLGVDLMSSSREPVDVFVMIGGQRALHVRLPGVSAGCAHPYIHGFDYALPAEPVQVHVIAIPPAENTSKATSTVRLDRGRRWVAVTVNDPVHLTLDKFTAEPAWG